jgi:nucleoid-associated protein YgaU
MANPEKARISNVSVDPKKTIEVLFNPTDYGINRGANYTEMQVPGLTTPILQFIRGEAQTIDLELFLDGTNKRTPIEADLETLRDFVRINGKLHAPPVCQFEWGKVCFQGVVTSLKEKFQLFANDGQVLRARVTLSMKSYESAEVQLRKLRRSSPDRTQVRVFREGESLALIANEVYGDPRLWRLIALENEIARPRFIQPGTPLRIPTDTGGA